ncbi:hypothetical protein NECAME_11536 [Necator americanus]|uniref:Uncharacterized protein n=1 Tax=Necator americanus TaxID=51031 RepID=W2T4X0_NECAM|nr:hypothetical protein NECAME_11536 [Necator americanus]ETN76634.1 hypothetical protein NECAME_11536 [Necator americanus]
MIQNSLAFCSNAPKYEVMTGEKFRRYRPTLVVMLCDGMSRMRESFAAFYENRERDQKKITSWLTMTLKK